MRLKTFTGNSMNDVMAQIKRDLGNDAVIVSSRTLEDGSMRVTAALDEEPIRDTIESLVDGVEDPAMLFGGIKDYGNLPDPDLDNKVERISKALVWHRVPSSLHDKIITIAEQSKSTGDARAVLAEAFAQIFRFHPLEAKPFETPLMLVGQPGAGKTTTIAKLAARGVMEHLKPAVITADTIRAGGVEQLAAFTKVLKLDLSKVNSPEQLKQALNDNKKADQVLVDCPGVNAFDAASMKELNTFIKVASMELIVALSGGLDVDESAEVARAFAVLGAKSIIPTRLDISRRLGGILAAADQANLAFAGMGHKADIATGFAPLNAETLATLILPPTKENAK
jgi:flagellar biosynthesis protein FlhF